MINTKKITHRKNHTNITLPKSHTVCEQYTFTNYTNHAHTK